MWLSRNGSVNMVDAAAYNMATLLSGIVALGALVFADWARPRVVPMLLGVAGAIAAFGLTAFVSGIFVLARLQEEVWFYGAGSYAGDPGRKQTIVPADGPYFFAIAALVGAIATLGLAIIWLRQPRGTRVLPKSSSPHAPFTAVR